MKIDFVVLGRKFRIKTASDTQVQLTEVKISENEESQSFGKEVETAMGYHNDEIAALKKLQNVLALTEPCIETFDQLAELREKILRELAEIICAYNLR